MIPSSKLLQSLKRIDNQDRATRETIRIAKERLTSKAKAITVSAYHPAILDLVLVKSEFLQFIYQCRSVLCVNKVRADFERWVRLAKRVNLDLDLEVTRLHKISGLGKTVKKYNADNARRASSLNDQLPVSLTDADYAEILARGDVSIVSEIGSIIGQENKPEAKPVLMAEHPIEKSSNARCRRFVALSKSKGKGVFECRDPYLLENGEKLPIAVTSFTLEMHQEICSSRNKKPVDIVKGEFGWWWNKKVNANHDGQKIQVVACQDLDKGMFDTRIKGSTTVMSGGVFQISHPRIAFSEVDMYFDLDSNPNAWERGYSWSTLSVHERGFISRSERTTHYQTIMCQ